MILVNVIFFSVLLFSLYFMQYFAPWFHFISVSFAFLSFSLIPRPYVVFNISRVTFDVIAARFTTRVLLFYLSANQMTALLLARWLHSLLLLRTTQDFGSIFPFIKTRNGLSLFNTKQAQVLGIEIPNSKYADIKVFEDSIAAFTHPCSSSFTYFPRRPSKKLIKMSCFLQTSSVSCFIESLFFVTGNMRTLKSQF